MDRVEFARKQIDRLSALAKECADPATREQLMKMARDYRKLLNSKARVEQRMTTPRRRLDA
jgi:hypothetical protein